MLPQSLIDQLVAARTAREGADASEKTVADLKAKLEAAQSVAITAEANVATTKATALQAVADWLNGPIIDPPVEPPAVQPPAVQPPEGQPQSVPVAA